MQRTPLFLLLVLLVGLSGCSSSDDTPAPNLDTTAPEIVSVTPADAAIDVAINTPIQVVFNEDMRPTTSKFGADSSPGELTLMSWTDARTLVIGHELWPDLTMITMSLESGFEDEAGNELAPFSWDFETIATVPELVSSFPEDMATNVNRNASVLLEFPTTMDLDSVKNATTVDFDDKNVSFGKVPVAFELAYNTDTQLIMTFEQDLPPLADVFINISTAALTLAGVPLAEPLSLTFATGTQIDETPPTLLSVEPTNGSTISANTSSIVFTFSEAINLDDLTPTMFSAQFFTLYGGEEIAAEVTPDGTQLVVQLPAPLPAGLPLAVVLSNIPDLAGNVQTEPVEYRVDVAGSGAPWPFVDGMKYAYYEDWESGPIKGKPQFGEGEAYYEVTEQANGTFYWTRYWNDLFTDPDEVSIFELTSTAIKQIADMSYDEGQIDDSVTINPGVEWARLPFAEGTWSGTSSVTFPEGVAQADYTITVLGREDLPSMMSGDGTEIVWLDVWKLTREWTLSVGQEILEEGEATHWYAPSIGVVKTFEYREESGEYEISTEELEAWLRP